MRYLVLLLAASFMLTGCGGGGGGGETIITPTPDPGSSTSADSVSLDEDDSVSINVTSNDRDVDPSTLGVSTSPSNGTAEVSGSAIVYTPDADFTGTDSFNYSVTGLDGAALSGTVNVTVNDVNDAPVAVADSLFLIEDNPLSLSELAENDTDIDDNIVSFQFEGDINGTISDSDGNQVYTPPLDFTGTVQLSYRAVDERGAASNLVVATIQVEPVVNTTLATESLSIPQSGYATVNDADLGATILVSETFELEVPPNAVSVLLSLSGPDANIEENGLFIQSLVPPSGAFPVFQRFVNFCFGGTCSSLVPRTPDYRAESGTWTYTLGTRASSLDEIDFSSLIFTAAMRSGPTPEVTDSNTTTVRVSPFLTTDSVSVSQLQQVLDRVVEIGASNQVDLQFEAVVQPGDPRFDSVEASFLDMTTRDLVGFGPPDTINLFFIESFTDTDGLAGISSAIPGHFGVQSGHNGLLVDVNAFGTDITDSYIQSTAETVFHEMGHLLGLYHTTEARFSANDVLDDTPNCEEAIHDTNNNGTANPSECPDSRNPMFWINSLLSEWELLTDDQKHVIYFSPVAVPQ